MKKVVGDYFDFDPLYKEATLKVWDLIVKVTSWVVRIFKKPELSLEFHFVKKWKPRLYEKNAILTYAGLGT
jgi:hypothetical protein